MLRLLLSAAFVASTIIYFAEQKQANKQTNIMSSGSAPAEADDQKPSFYSGKRSSPNSSNNNSISSKSAAAAGDYSTDRSLFHSIAAHQSVLLPNKMTTLVIYIPTSSVGAVIGRKGQNITALQKLMAAAAATTSHSTTTTTTTTSSSSSSICNPRVSVVGPNDPPDSIPYTYSTLDWSEVDQWTPVVIRAGDAVAALTAATRILALTKDMHDGVVMDLPLAAHKHAALVGKKGLQLANLSADHGVRIFVPPREQKDDIIQLEGSLGQVKRCLRDLLVAVASKSPTATQQKVIVLQQLPPASRLRQIQRRTETFVRKKKMETVVVEKYDHHDNDDGGGVGGGGKTTTTIMVWQLTITGSSTEQVELAADLLQGKIVSKPPQQQQQQSPPRRSNSDTVLGAAGTTSSNNAFTDAPRRRGRGRGRGKNSNIGSGTPNNSNNNNSNNKATSDGGSPNSNNNKAASDGGSPNSNINKAASSDGGSPGNSHNNNNNNDKEEEGLET